jgi:hypothetical protein
LSKAHVHLVIQIDFDILEETILKT